MGLSQCFSLKAFHLSVRKANIASYIIITTVKVISVVSNFVIEIYGNVHMQTFREVSCLLCVLLFFFFLCLFITTSVLELKPGVVLFFKSGNKDEHVYIKALHVPNTQ